MRRSGGRTPVRSCARAMLVVAAFTLALSQSTRAQDSTSRAQDSIVTVREAATARPHGWIVGPLVGLPGAGSEAAYPLLTLGVGVTRFVPNEPGIDFAIGTAPYALAFGVIPVAARLGPSIPIELGPDAFLIPSAGISAVAFAGDDVVPPVLGWYWGGAAVVARGSVGLRVGVTWHQVPHSEPSVWLVEVGVMHVPVPQHIR